MANEMRTIEQMHAWPRIAPFTFHEAENAKLRDYWREFSFACHGRLLAAVSALEKIRGESMIVGTDSGHAGIEAIAVDALNTVGEVPRFSEVPQR